MNDTMIALQTNPPGRLVAFSFALYFSVDGDYCRMAQRT